jgi:hypothetical protein
MVIGGFLSLGNPAGSFRPGWKLRGMLGPSSSGAIGRGPYPAVAPPLNPPGAAGPGALSQIVPKISDAPRLHRRIVTDSH